MPFPFLNFLSGTPGQPPVQQFPSPEQLYPMYPSRRWLPFTPRGLLDQYPDVSGMLGMNRGNYGMLGQTIADKIIPFRRTDNPFTEMRDPGTGGGRGLLGSQWRDPNFIQQYEVQQGLKPGSLQPVGRPPAGVTSIAPPGGRQFDFGRFNDKVTDPRMLTPEARGPTPAQMARPVRMTPEIAAKLQAARDARASGEGMKLVTDARAWVSAGKNRLPFDSKVLADRFNKMSSEQQEIFNREMFPWDYR